ncbi:MAG: beta-glucosidase [Polaribacter sp.]|jgi:beta-glucosidase
MNKNSLTLLFLGMALIATLYSCHEAMATVPQIEGQTMDDSEDTDRKVKELLVKMTLEEKIGQMNQYTGFFDPTGPAPKDDNNKNKYEQVKKGLVGSMLNVRGAKEVRAMQQVAVENSRLGIPLIFGFDVIHGFKTTAPIPLAEAASWDLEAIKKSARMAAIEASAAGLNWTFAPMVDISRDARWGRVMEGAGEDTYLGAKVGVARVEGFQGDDLSANNTIAACAKHFAGYGFAEAGKDYNTADVGTTTLYNVILPPFKAVSKAGVATFMNSFNELNGVPATADKFLQRDILKGEWGFEGFVVSDWGSISEMIAHGYAKDGKHAAELAANAGSDMDMESHLYIKHLKDLVNSGKVDIANIDDAVSRILKIKFDMGLFDDPYRYCNEEREKKLMFNKDQMDAALDMAKKSIVLLKNDEDILPLGKSGQNIAVIGPLADDKTSPLGNWRLAADNNTATSVMEGLKKYSDNKYSYAKGVNLVMEDTYFHAELKINETDRSGMKEAVELAKKSDMVILVLGEHGMMSGEGRSRSEIDLPGLQQELLEEICSVNKNVVLVLMNGRPLAIPWAVENVSAVVEAWHLGVKSGEAIAEVLYGDYNPSGKLPMTFPRSVGQVPIYYNYKNTGRPGPKAEVFWQHYTDMTNDPLFVFGHGLSYTTFTYSNLKVNKVANQVNVTIDLKNTGKVAGEEVVQLYIRDRYASVTRPVKELKGFEKLALNAGESKTISFTLTEKELGFYNAQGKFIIESGAFDVMVGGSSDKTMNGDFEW